MPVPYTEIFGPDLMQKALVDIGVTYELLAKQVKAELKASNEVQVDGKVKRIPIWPIRQKAREDCQKLLGAYPVEKKDVHVHGAIGQMSDEQIDARIRSLLETGIVDVVGGEESESETP
jgi:hypothetical protein